MSLEDNQPGQIPDRCEECGAKLTARELEETLERGGPVLCSIHAAEDEPAEALDSDVDDVA